jgi:hypothetical protein
MFYTGQEVECIDDSGHPELNVMIEGCVPNLDGLTKGRKYVVRWYGSKIAYTKKGLFMMPHIRVNEIIRDKGKDGEEAAFLALRFKPLVKRTTDISTFTKLLRPTPQPVRKKENENVKELTSD